MTDRASEDSEQATTVRIGRRRPGQDPAQPGPGEVDLGKEPAAAGPARQDQPDDERGERTVLLSKRDLQPNRPDHDVPPPRSPADAPGAPPTVYAPPPSEPAYPGEVYPPTAPQVPPAYPPSYPPYPGTPNAADPFAGPSYPPAAAYSPSPYSPGPPPTAYYPQNPPPQWPGGGYPPPQQPVGPPLPPPRGRRHTGLIVFGLLGALVIAIGATALIMLANGQSLFGEPTATETPRAEPPSISAAPSPSFSAPPPLSPSTSAAPDVGDGPSGSVTVNWTLLGTNYQAAVTTSGSTGTADVTYINDPAAGTRVTVREDLTLQDVGGRPSYVGSNPRDASTGAPASNYAPDIFLLATNESGEVYVEEVCDTTAQCAPATTG